MQRSCPQHTEKVSCVVRQLKSTDTNGVHVKCFSRNSRRHWQGFAYVHCHSKLQVNRHWYMQHTLHSASDEQTLHSKGKRHYSTKDRHCSLTKYLLCSFMCHYSILAYRLVNLIRIEPVCTSPFRTFAALPSTRPKEVRTRCRVGNIKKVFIIIFHTEIDAGPRIRAVWLARQFSISNSIAQVRSKRANWNPFHVYVLSCQETVNH